MSADLLFDDYKVKLDYLRGQYDRLWQRFNFFLTVELALFGFLGYLTFDLKMPETTFLPCVVGIVVSLLWWVVGAEDRRLVEVYRDRADKAAARFGSDPGGWPGFEHDHAGAGISVSWVTVRSFYWPALSMTRMPATFGILFTFVWLLLLILWRPVVATLVQRPVT